MTRFLIFLSIFVFLSGSQYSYAQKNKSKSKPPKSYRKQMKQKAKSGQNADDVLKKQMESSKVLKRYKDKLAALGKEKQDAEDFQVPHDFRAVYRGAHQMKRPETDEPHYEIVQERRRPIERREFTIEIDRVIRHDELHAGAGAQHSDRRGNDVSNDVQQDAEADESQYGFHVPSTSVSM